MKKRTFSKEFSIKGCLFQNWTFINVHFRKNLPFYNFKKKNTYFINNIYVTLMVLKREFSNFSLFSKNAKFAKRQ